MPKRIEFGTTWWGKAWVHAMENLDRDANRLPRGKTYARNGSVLSIQIDKETIKARVQGRRRSPYKISITVQQFSASEQRVWQEIASNPAVAGDLGIGTMSPDILALCQANGLALLPTSWGDFYATCSCPDWANPCKHLAAVYYTVANEIDKDPLLILRLRGISYEKHGTSPEGNVSERLSFLPYKEVKAKAEEVPLPSFAVPSGGAIFRLLESNPLFYQEGDFRDVLVRAYHNVTRGVEDLESVEQEDLTENLLRFMCYPNSSPQEWFVFSNEKITGRKRQRLAILRRDEERLIEASELGALLSPSDTLSRYLALPLETDNSALSREDRYLRAISAAALSLAKAQQYAPAILQQDSGKFLIEYRPLVNTPQLTAIIEYLEQTYPPELMARVGDLEVLAPHDGVRELLTLFLTYIFHEHNGITQQDKICATFFAGVDFTPGKFSEEQTASAVAHWLASTTLASSYVTPVLKIEPIENQRFQVTVEFVAKSDPLGKSVPLNLVLNAKSTILGMPAAKARQNALEQISIAAKYYSPLRLITGSELSLVLDSIQAAELMVSIKPVFELLGMKIQLPKELRSIVRPTLTVQAKTDKPGRTYLELNQLLDFSWKIAIGDQLLSPDEFLQLAESARGIVQVREQYVYLDPQVVAGLLGQITTPPPRLSSAELLQASLTGEMGENLFVPDEGTMEMIRSLTSPPAVDPPMELHGELRPYQVHGYQWVYHHLKNGVGCCLADDMGLGKTIQTIATILRLKAEGLLANPVLLVCPTSVVGNWEKECAKFAPSLRVGIYHGQDRKLEAGVDILLTSYGTGRAEQGKLKKRKWGLVVLDEAQNIKNPDAQQTKALKSLKADGYLALTGTPVENRLRELWSIFDFLNPGFFGNAKHFHKQYAQPIEKYNDAGARRRLGLAVSPFILRRLKSDSRIINDLPDKLVEDEYCYLTKSQVAMYQAVVEETMADIESSDGIARRGLIFKLLTSLKQICNHPVQYRKTGAIDKSHSGKAERLIELVQAFRAGNEQVLIFTQYREMVQLLKVMIEEELGLEPLIFDGHLTRTKRERAVTAFQSGESPVMIVSLKAGGTGLNLTAASAVIHYDLWWNPAVEAQATDRAYRIGQQRSVTVKRLITLGTFEEKINEMLESKRELADMILSGSEGALGDLTNQELGELFRLSSD